MCSCGHPDSAHSRRIADYLACAGILECRCLGFVLREPERVGTIVYWNPRLRRAKRFR